MTITKELTSWLAKNREPDTLHKPIELPLSQLRELPVHTMEVKQLFSTDIQVIEVFDADPLTGNYQILSPHGYRLQQMFNILCSATEFLNSGRASKDKGTKLQFETGKCHGLRFAYSLTHSYPLGQLSVEIGESDQLQYPRQQLTADDLHNIAAGVQTSIRDYAGRTESHGNPERAGESADKLRALHAYEAGFLAGLKSQYYLLHTDWWLSHRYTVEYLNGRDVRVIPEVKQVV